MSLTNVIMVPTSPGELLDKITILLIKAEKITDPAHLENIKTELALMQETRQSNLPNDHRLFTKLIELEEDLKKVNEVIWDQSEKLRNYLESNDHSAQFIEISVGIHSSNDKRAAIKKEINLLLKSRIIEEKSYKNWN